MYDDDTNAGDWFKETFSNPCRDFRTLLDDPRLVEKIAMTRAIHAICPHLRGDGKKPGHSIITYGLPLFFPEPVSHPQTRYLAELAGIAPAKKSRGVRFTPPCEEKIAEAMKRIQAALATRLRESVETLTGVANL